MKKIFAFVLAAALIAVSVSSAYAAAGGAKGGGASAYAAAGGADGAAALPDGAQPGGAPKAPDSPAEVTGKDEVVYARLAGNGDVRDIYVVNHFTLSSGGALTDYGDYSTVLNMTDLGLVVLENGSVSASASGSDFYYQGNLASKNLPWVYTIEYLLDGARIDAGLLGGCSGALEIRIGSEKNSAVDSTFHDNYMQQITITLDSGKCSNITAAGATAATAGKSHILVFTILPKQNAAISVTADVSDFAMTGIEITGMPFSMSFSIPDVDDMLDDFTLLSDAIAALNSGVVEMDSGTSEMVSGARQLLTGSADFRTGLAALDNNSGQLISGSTQILDALGQISSALNEAGSAYFGDGSSMEISGLAGLPVFFSLLTGGLNQVSGSLKQLRDSYGPAYAALNASVSGLPGYKISGEMLGSLYEKATDEESVLLDQLYESYTAAMTVKSTYSGVQEALASISGSLDSLSGSIDSTAMTLAAINEQIDALTSGNGLSDLTEQLEQLEQLADGISVLSANYRLFHSGLVEYAGGVSALAEGYGIFDNGFCDLYTGIEGLSDGISQFSGGVGALAAETSDMPDRVKTEIDSLVSDFSAVAFKPVSFTSSRNSDTGFVQFVLKTEGIEKPAVADSAPIEAAQPSFLDRLIALFKNP